MGSGFDGKGYRLQVATSGTGQCHGQRFRKAANRLGFNRTRVELDLQAFRPLGPVGQGSLF